MLHDDLTLVREFAARQSESAFAELIRRHISLVHSAARRQTAAIFQPRKLAAFCRKPLRHNQVHHPFRHDDNFFNRLAREKRLRFFRRLR